MQPQKVSRFSRVGQQARNLILALATMLVSAAFAPAQSQDDLPSAPSAVQQQAQHPAPPPVPAAPKQAAAPASSGSDHVASSAAQPAADSMEPPKNPPASATNTSAIPNAKSNASDLEPDTETIKVPVNEVNLIFTATDKHGHFVKDLKQQDVKVVDDHKPVDKILSFHSETDLPLRVGLLIDASNSIRERFKFEQESAIEFLGQIVRPKTDQAFVLGFDTVSEVTQDFTNDTEKLARGIRTLRPGGGTALYDAVYSACRDKLMKVSEGEAVRRAIILVSDGEDNQSRVTREEAIAMAQRAEVIIYTISTNTSGLVLKGDKVLQRIAEETGGRAFFPFKIEDVANAFQDIQDELRSQYALAYKPPDFHADGRYRSIEIAADSKKTHIRARKGYYSPTSQ
jgi:Ca-activated chloride channel family protein